jgi:tetratricopeptide (TPR) repeat protein
MAFPRRKGNGAGRHPAAPTPSLWICSFLDACTGAANIVDVRRPAEVERERRSAPARAPRSAASGKAGAGKRGGDTPATRRTAKTGARGEKTSRPRTQRKAAPATSQKPAPKARAEAPRVDSPEEMLHRAMGAQTPRSRAIWARRGLASARRLDRTTQSMLLRQLYLAHYEDRRFDKALEVSLQNIELSVLPDVAHQDAARAAQALGDVDAAAGHLRLAARTGPPKRRAFHWWTLGSLYYLAGRYDEAISALARAARWGTTDKPLYQGHLAIARCASGEAVPDLAELIERLAGVPAGRGYGRFVLGQLAFHDQRWDEARRHLEAFVARSSGGRTALAIALDGEIARARETLSRIPKS